MKNYSSQLLNLNPIVYDNTLLAVIQQEIDKEKILKEEKQFFFDALSDLINGLAKHDIFIHTSKDLTERDTLFDLLNLGCTNKLSCELEKMAVYAYARYNNERYHKNILECITSVCNRVYCAEENDIYQELVNNLVQNHKYLFLENSYAPTTPETILALDNNVQDTLKEDIYLSLTGSKSEYAFSHSQKAFSRFLNWCKYCAQLNIIIQKS